MKEEHTRIQRQDANSKMNFGRYREKTYAEVLQADPQYCEWAKMTVLKKQESGATPTLELARFVRWLDRYHVVSRQAQRSGQTNVSVESDWEVIYRENEALAETVLKNQQAALDQMDKDKKKAAPAAAPAASAGDDSNDEPMTTVRPIMLSPKNSKKIRGGGQLPALPETEDGDL